MDLVCHIMGDSKSHIRSDSKISHIMRDSKSRRTGHCRLCAAVNAFCVCGCAFNVLTEVDRGHDKPGLALALPRTGASAAPLLSAPRDEQAQGQPRQYTATLSNPLSLPGGWTPRPEVQSI